MLLAEDSQTDVYHVTLELARQEHSQLSNIGAYTGVMKLAPGQTAGSNSTHRVPMDENQCLQQPEPKIYTHRRYFHGRCACVVLYWVRSIQAMMVLWLFVTQRLKWAKEGFMLVVSCCDVRKAFEKTHLENLEVMNVCPRSNQS